MRRRRAWTLFEGLANFAVMFLGVFAASQVLGLPASGGLPTATVCGAVFGVGAAYFAWSAQSGEPLRGWVNQVIALVLAASAGGAAALSVRWGSGSSGAAVVVGTLVAGCVAVLFLRTMERKRPEQLRGPLRARTAEEAEHVVTASRQELAAVGLTARQRGMVEINLAQALADRAVLADADDGLAEALNRLERLVGRGDLDPYEVILAARALVEATEGRWYKNRDSTGWADAIALLRTAVARVPARTDLLDVLDLKEGEYCTERAFAEDDEAAVRTWGNRALGHYRAVADRHAASHWMHGVALLSIVDLLTSWKRPTDPEEILRVARAARAARLPRGELRWRADLSLAHALLQRAMAGGPGAAADIREAVELSRRRLRGRSRWAAAGTLAQLLDLAEQQGILVPAGWPGSPGEAYRLALAEAERFDTVLAPTLARGWAEWAARTRNTAEAADAFWALVVRVPRELRRQYRRDSRERFAAGSQGTAAEAGHWLAAAGRTGDAVVAVEYSRAILLTDAAGRDLAELADELDRHGRPDLVERYGRAAAAVDEQDRGQYAGMSAGGTRFVPELHRVWTDFEAVNREIGRVLGRSWGEVPDYRDVARAARLQPLVYLAAAELTGYALVVPAAGEPFVVWLPKLTRQALDVRVSTYLGWLGAEPARWRHEVPALLEDLWTVAMARVFATLPDGWPPPILLPVGPLALLPLHAAAVGRHPRPPAVSYAPNARLVERSRRMADDADSGGRSVLAVDAPVAPGRPDLAKLCHTGLETDRIQQIYGRERCLRTTWGTHGEVTGELTGHSVWHFACHGHANLVEPLDSALLLTDRPLTVREIMAQKAAPHRLAVLAACETGVPDLDLLDEVVSLPGALLRAGVAGVVSAAWPVADLASALLLIRFHELWEQGGTPAVALARAQEWLRTATNAELRCRAPRVLRPPRLYAGARLPRWEAYRPFAAPYYWAGFSVTGV